MPSCSRESVGTAQFTCRMRLGTSKTLLLGKHVSSSLFDVPNSSCIVRRCKKIRKKFTDQASYEELQYVLPVLDTRGKRPILPVHLGRLCPGLNSCPVLALMYTSLDQSETATNSCSRSTRIPGHYPTYTAALAMSRPSGPRNWKLFFWVQGMNATPRLPELRLVVVVPLDLKTIAVLTFQIFACWFIASAQHRICIYGMCTMLAHMFLKGHNSTVYNGILRYASLKFMSCSSCFQLIVSIHCIHPDIVDTYNTLEQVLLSQVTSLWWISFAACTQATLGIVGSIGGHQRSLQLVKSLSSGHDPISCNHNISQS